MKLVVLSYSHHGRGMARTAHGLGHDIVGVMDGDAVLGNSWRRSFNAVGSSRQVRVSMRVSQMRHLSRENTSKCRLMCRPVWIAAFPIFWISRLPIVPIACVP